MHTTSPSIESVLRSFWVEQEKSLLARLAALPSDSVDRLVAGSFHQATKHQVRLFEELDWTRAMKPWTFYTMREKALLGQFGLKPV